MSSISKRLDYTIWIGLLVLVIGALGPGIWGKYATTFSNAVPYQSLFEQLCHQLPDRCFIVEGWIMPVCSRCIGIYSGLMGSWFIILGLRTLVPEFSLVGKTLYGWGVLLILALLIIDYLGNLLGYWLNTLWSRYFIGLLFGVILVCYIRSKPNGS